MIGQGDQITEASAGELEAGEWRPVVGFEGLYSVSSTGDLRSDRTGKVQSKHLAGAGYVKALLSRDGIRTQTTVHRVAATAFLPAPSPDHNEVNHKDGDKQNNRVENLEWVTRNENQRHSRYALGHGIQPVIASNVQTGKEAYYASPSVAARDGFRIRSIWRCLVGQMKTHHGHSWRKTDFRPDPRQAIHAGEAK